MLVALTGASGFVGTYTVKALHQAGHRVRALVRRNSQRDAIAPFVSEWCVGEQEDPQIQAALVAGAEAVIHNSADWEALGQGPGPNFRKNVLASLELLEAARRFEVEQFLFVSSVAVNHTILNEPNCAIDETHPTWPSSIYGAYKAAIEPHLIAYHNQYGMNTSAYRPAAIYGLAPDVKRSQWHDLIKTVRDRGTISTAQGGKITHVQDVADALTLAIGDKGVAGQLYNLVDGYLHWQQVAEIARELTGSAATIEEKKGPGAKNQYNCAKAIAFFDRHGNTAALRRGIDGVRGYVKELLGGM